MSKEQENFQQVENEILALPKEAQVAVRSAIALFEDCLTELGGAGIIAIAYLGAKLLAGATAKEGGSE